MAFVASGARGVAAAAAACARRRMRRCVTRCGATTPKNKALADWTKYGVCAAVAGVVLYKRDASTLVYVTAAVLNSALGKLLKRLVKQPRPRGAHKQDAGMPSSHATSLSFLSLAFAAHAATFAHSAGASVGAGALVALALLASYWRVSARYHTLAQVAAGWLLGALNSLLYMAWLPRAVALARVLMRGGGALCVTSGVLLAAALLIGGADVLAVGARIAKLLRPQRDA